MTAPHDSQWRHFDAVAYCARLPAPEPPPALLDATLRAYRRRRTRRGALLATAAGVAIVAVGAALQLLVPVGSSPQAPPTAAVAGAASTPAASRVDTLRDIDRSLQAAYDAGASDAEVEALWAQRTALSGRQPAAVPLSL